VQPAHRCHDPAAAGGLPACHPPRQEGRHEPNRNPDHPAAQPPHPSTTTIPEAARLLGISRSAAYRAVARGEIPTIRIGRRLLIPTGKLHTMLGWTYNNVA